MARRKFPSSFTWGLFQVRSYDTLIDLGGCKLLRRRFARARVAQVNTRNFLAAYHQRHTCRRVRYFSGRPVQIQQRDTVYIP